MKTIQLSFTLFLFLFVAQSTLAQKHILNERYLVSTTSGPQQMSQPLSFIAEPNQADMRFNPTVKNISSQNKEKAATLISNFKLDNHDLKGRMVTDPLNVYNDNETKDRDVDFNVGQNFYGDIDGGCPNDNTISISKGGKIISMMNGAVGIYTSNGAKVNTYGLSSFFNNQVSDPCDPKVEYDKEQDRFFMFVQACGNTIDNVAFGFSLTNDPGGSWYIYTFKSDIFNDGSMSDYPKVSITKNEIFVSLNLFGLSGGNYKQSIVYQLNKMNGFSGQNLNYQIWKDFTNGTLLPIRSGVNQYGPGVYLINTNSFSGNEVTLYDITNNLGSNPQLKTYKIPVAAFEVPLSANQQGSNQKVDSGDCRAQDGYYQNGIIHFVHTVSNQGYGAVRYFRLNEADLDGNDFFTTSDPNVKDYSYPSISPFTNSSTDQTSIVHFGAVGTNHTPEMRAKVFNHDFTTKASQLIVKGNGPVTQCYSNDRGYNRWGDYTGIALQYNTSVPTVWVAGSIASLGVGEWWTYIAELNASGTTTPVEDLNKINSWNVFPNPTSHRLNVFIELNTKQEVIFTLVDHTGKNISNLYQDILKEGTNRFSFDCSSLQDGLYLLIVKNSKNEIIKSEKIVVSK